MKDKRNLAKLDQITHRIFVIRGQRVIIDSDLAAIYGVPVKRLNEQVKRNRHRFPNDFLLRLTMREATFLRSQFATLNASEKGRGQHRKYLPYAFTEHGAIMAANILNSERAVKMSVFVVRAFLKMRVVLANHQELSEELKKLERKLTKRLDVHELAIVDVLRRIMRLLEPKPEPTVPEKPKRQIGFHP